MSHLGDGSHSLWTLYFLHTHSHSNSECHTPAAASPAALRASGPMAPAGQPPCHGDYSQPLLRNSCIYAVQMKLSQTRTDSHQTLTQMTPCCTHMPPSTSTDWTLLQPPVSGRLTLPSVRTTLLPRRPQRSNRVREGSENSWKDPDSCSLSSTESLATKRGLKGSYKADGLQRLDGRRVDAAHRLQVGVAALFQHVQPAAEVCSLKCQPAGSQGHKKDRGVCRVHDDVNSSTWGVI